MSKALLVFPVKGVLSSTTAYAVTITRLSGGYQNQLGTATVRDRRHSYPIRIKEQDIGITIQCSSVAEYDAINKTIAITQKLSTVDVNRGFVRFSYPQLNMDYLGFIAQVPTGVARFVAAPQLSFTLSLFKDTINTVTQQYSTINGTWRDIAGEDLVDLPKSALDEILYNLSPRPRATPTSGINRAV